MIILDPSQTAQAGHRHPHQGIFSGPLDTHATTFRDPYVFGSLVTGQHPRPPNETAQPYNFESLEDDESQDPTPSVPASVPRLANMIWGATSPSHVILRPPPSVLESLAATSHGPGGQESVAAGGPSLSFVGFRSPMKTIIDIFETVRIFIFLLLKQRLDLLLTQDRHPFAYPKPTLCRLHENWAYTKKAAVCDDSGPTTPYRLIKPKLRRDILGTAEPIWDIIEYLGNSAKEHFAASLVYGFSWSAVEQAETVLVSAGQNSGFKQLYTQNVGGVPSALLKDLAGIDASDPTATDCWDFQRDSIHKNKVCIFLLQTIETLVSQLYRDFWAASDYICTISWRSCA